MNTATAAPRLDLELRQEAVQDPLSPETIKARIDAYYARQITISQSQTNRASEIGHPCERYLVYRRTASNHQEPHSLGLQKIFSEGNTQERAVVEMLGHIGYDVLVAQQHYMDNKHLISGHIDGRLVDRETGHSVLLEIKSCSPNRFRNIRTASTVEELEKVDSSYSPKYIDQLHVYMIGEGVEESLLLFKDKSSGDVHLIRVNLEPERAKALLEKADRINAHVKAETLPDQINDPDLCPKCPFRTHCGPAILHAPLMPTDDPELAEMIERHQELKPYASEYNKLDRAIKSTLKAWDGLKFLVGKYLIIGKVVKRSAYHVDASEYTQYKIQEIEH